MSPSSQLSRLRTSLRNVYPQRTPAATNEDTTRPTNSETVKIPYVQGVVFPPGIGETIRDPYWKNFTFFWLCRAQNRFDELSENTLRGGALSPSEQAHLDQQIESIRKLSKEYEECLIQKKASKCRSRAREIVVVVSLYSLQVTFTVERAQQAPPVDHTPPFPFDRPEVRKVWKKIHERHLHGVDLDTKKSPMIRFDKERHKSTVNAIAQWTDRNDKTVLFLHGLEGCGKSSVAFRVARSLQNNDQLVGGFFFHGTSPTCPVFSATQGRGLQRHFLANLIPTMGDAFGPNFVAVFSKYAVAADESIPGFWDGSLSRQFMELIVPTVKELYPPSAIPPPFFIVVDGMNDLDLTARDALFEMIQFSAVMVPSIRYILAGRLDEDLSTRLQSGSLGQASQLHEIISGVPAYCDPASHLSGDGRPICACVPPWPLWDNEY